MPSAILLGAATLALTLSTILACSWPTGQVDGIDTQGLASRNPKAMAFYVWLYCIFWWFIQDFAKVFCYYLMEKYNTFGINDTLRIDETKDMNARKNSESLEALRRNTASLNPDSFRRNSGSVTQPELLSTSNRQLKNEDFSSLKVGLLANRQL
jgi:H+-transporting ATPase